MFSSKTIKIITGLVLLGIIGIGGFYIGHIWTSKQDQKVEAADFSQIRSIRQQGNTYQFINPLLAYDLPESKDFGEYTDLANRLNQLIDSEKSQYSVSDVSIYFRGSQGHWVGINDTEGYYPASLLKVVVMIAYYQQAQTDATILDKQLTYTSAIENQVTTSEFNVPSSLKLNQSYKISDLISSMIVNSDNGATFTLLNSLDSKSLDEIYGDLGLNAPANNPDYKISASDYSLFFRILYNATYLDREYSEKALSLLSESTFKLGLVSGLPAGTVVAHKFGEHILTDNNGVQIGIELHDCGFVYAKQKFLLCIMTRGQKLEDLETTIKDITSLVYTEAEK